MTLEELKEKYKHNMLKDKLYAQINDCTYEYYAGKFYEK